MKSHP